MKKLSALIQFQKKQFKNLNQTNALDERIFYPKRD